MKRNSLLFFLLAAMFMPLAMNAQSLFTEDFEGGSMPSGWTQDGPNTWVVGSGDYSTTTGAGQGTYNAYVTHIARGNVTKLITPEIDLSSVPSAMLSFMHVQRSWGGDIDELRVYYRTSSSGTWTQLVEYTDAVDSWTTEEDIVLPNTTATYQLAFEHTDNYGYGVGLDQIVISAPSACPKPTLGPAEYISEESASFQWTENGSATQWELQYSTSADFTNPTTINRNGIPALAVSGLSSGTTYYFRVRSSCGVGEYSDWSNVVSFNTLCSTYSLPYAYGFEDDGDLDCWTVVYTANTPGINTDEHHSGSNCFRFSSYNSASSYDQYLISPMFNGSGSKEFSFYYKPYSYGTEIFMVGYSTTTNETSAFTWGDEIVTTAGSDWALYEATYPAGTKYVAIHYYSNYAYYLYVDDFNFEISSGCAKPTNPTLVSSGNTITATWSGSADTYNIDINGTVTNNVTSPYTFTGEFATIYTVKVQANCGGGETSGWTNPQSVTTDPCAPEDMCRLTFELTDSWGDGWNGAYISVVDVASGIEIAQMSADDHGGGNVASTDTKTLAVCDGRVINFVWISGNFDDETSYVVKDFNDDVVFSGSQGSGLITNYTVNCTVSSCPKPTNLTVTNLTPTSATLNWEGEADSYNVKYRKVGSNVPAEGSFFDDFENGLGNWTLIVNAEGTGWQQFDATAIGEGFTNYSGNYVAMARSYEGGVDITGDNWMISPLFNSIPNTMTYWARNDGLENHQYDETYDVCVSLATNSTSDFEIVQTFTTTPYEWEQITIDLSAYAGREGYIAFHHHDDAKDMLLIDDVLIGSMTNSDNQWIEATTTANYIDITGLESETEYEWQVQAVCGTDGESSWSTVATFTTTDGCAAFNLPYAYGFETDDINCWSGGSMNTENSIGITNEVAYEGSSSFLFSSYNSASDYNQYLISPELNTTTAVLVSFYYNRPSSSGDESFKVGYSTTTNDISAFTWEYDIAHTTVTEWTLFEETMPTGTKYVAINYYSDYQYYLVVDDFNFISSACGAPIDLTAVVTGNAAELSWTGSPDTYNLQYREVDPTVPATIILNIPEDVWGDGSGYQMLMDADATAFGTIIPATGGLTASGDASAETYAEFEYKLPTNADGSCSTSNILVTGQLSIEIPAGTYDWCITNPTPGDRVWIASSNGNVGGRQDDYVFEPATTYEFTIYLSGSNDAVDVTVTDNGNAWTLVEGVTNPYTLENLSAQTTYKYQVQGIDCDGNGGTTNWSASASFTTGEFYIKHIEAYTSDGGYYLIASPVGQVSPDNVDGMLDNEYDLYYFDQTQDLEWINYKDLNNGSYDLVPGKGYLYANSANVDLVFSGSAYAESGEVTLALESGAEFEGLNLVGNPFAKEAYIADSRDFYRLAEGGAEVMTEASTGIIDPMEGVFVYAESNNETMTFTTERPDNKVARLALNLTQGRGNVIDRAVVRFGNGQMLPKFQLNPNHTKVYMTVESKDYAVVCTESEGEMPVSFKAAENGTYTLSIDAENVEFGYLHLIDNMTGNDVDLLSTPSYSFEAKTTDYANRFRLVFNANSNSDDFAFFNGSNWTVTNEGNAILQVVDVMGRIISSENISGNANISINAAQGVYMLRLVNGENVKVQKVVVR